MGNLVSRTRRVDENSETLSLSSAFRYPAKTGNYFANHFIMGGERFDSPQPEAYLFGENADLNFLTGRPVPFPYSPPISNDLSKPLKSVINIRRESLRLVRILNDFGTGLSGYNIEFNFDADVSCVIRIMYFAKEEFINHGLSYIPADATLSSEKYSYKKGSNQLFNQTCHVFDPSKFADEELNYSDEREIIPVVIHCITEEDEEVKQTHVTLAVVEKYPDGSYVLKALKQKQCIEGLSYLLQEVYGIENKTAAGVEYDSGDEEYEESGGDCVVCMSDPRDTLILPCRHLCLCNGCAESLRYQANNCPICRSPFRALLQIRTLQKRQAGAAVQVDRGEEEENVPNGYEVVSLIEALNGPSAVHHRRASHVKKTDSAHSPPESPTTIVKTPVPRARKRSKKNIAKMSNQEETQVVVQPGSPARTLKASNSGTSNSVPDLSDPRAEQGTFKSLPRGLDHVEVVTELTICPSTVKRLEDEEDGKDSDQTTDSTSSARSFNPLLRHGSQDSVVDVEADLGASGDAK